MSSKLKQFYDTNRISLLTILGVISGLVSGLLVKWLFWPNGQPVDPYLLRYISLPGIIYIRAFLLLIVPLLIASLSTSLLLTDSDLKVEDNVETKSKDNEKGNLKEIDPNRLLLTTLVFFVCCSSFAVTLGMCLMVIVQPGAISSNGITDINQSNQTDFVKAIQKRIDQRNYRSDSIYNLILNVFPDNLISELFSIPYTQTHTIWPLNLTEIIEPNYVPELKQQTTYSYKPNMIGICVVSFLLGLLLKKLGSEKTRIVRQLLKETNSLVAESFGFLLKLMPFGMFCWMFSEALKMKSITSVAVQLVYFYCVLFVAFVILLMIFYPILHFVFTRENAFVLYQYIVPAILVAVGTTSSAITLPVTMKCMQDKLKLSKPIAQMVLPLGMTIHMNGPAMYYPMVAIFIAQIKQIPVDPVMLFVLGLFSVAMSMGFPASPSGGMTFVNHIAFASVIGIDNPQDVLAFIMSFEWFWSRIRTPANIIGDCFVAKWVEKLLDSAEDKAGESTDP